MRIEGQYSELVLAIDTPICVIGGDDDDEIIFSGTAGGTSGEYSGNVVSATAVGGPGADIFRYQVNSANSDYVYRPPFLIKDYEAGVDSIEIDAASALVDGTVGVNSISVIDDFDATSTSAEYSSSTNYALVVDVEDGEIWLSRYNEGQYNYLIGVIEGDEIDVDDIEVLLP